MRWLRNLPGTVREVIGNAVWLAGFLKIRHRDGKQLRGRADEPNRVPDPDYEEMREGT